MRRSVAVLAAFVLPGCAGWGMMEPHDASSAAVRSALARQVVQPGGKPQAPPPEGLDGRAAHRGYQKLEKSFDEKGGTSKAAGSGMGSKGDQ